MFLYCAFDQLPWYVVCWALRKLVIEKWLFNPVQPSVAFHIETRHLICNANQITGFYMKCKCWAEMSEDCTANV